MNRFPPSCTRPSAAFTLIEVLLVVAILGVLAAISTRLISNKVAEAQNVTVEAQLNSLQKALTVYQQSHGTLPDTLDELARPTGGGAASAGRNKTLLSLSQLRDPWRNAFVYDPAGGIRGGYSLLSLGADGLPGGEGPNADRSR